MDFEAKEKRSNGQLERRVRKLEDQTVILKNQIQNSLLEIQEILAQFRHPALRSSGDIDSVPTAPPARYEPDRLREQTEQPVSRARVQKVPMDNAGRSQKAAGGSSGGTGVDLVAFAELVNWANMSVARVGSVHTRGAIDVCLEEGSLSALMADQLRQLAGTGQFDDSADDIDPDEVAAVTADLQAILGRQAHS